MRAVGCGLLLAAAAAAQQAPPVVVGVPAAVAPAVTPVLAALFGAEVKVEPIVAATEKPIPGLGIYLLVDEWLLARGAAVGLFAPLPELPAAPRDAPRDPAASFVLPFEADYAAAVAPEVAAAVGSPVLWEVLALRPELHDRLGLVRPEVDGSPWLLAMRHSLVRRERADGGFALWTTLDARAGALRSGYGELLADLAAGRLAVAVMPRAALDAAARAHPGRFGVVPLEEPARARFGVAVAAAAPAGAASVAVRLLQPEALRAIAGAAGCTVAASGPAPLPAADGLSFWARFEANVRGRGRSVEQLADWLDLVLGAAFLLLLWLLLRSQRRREAGMPG